MTAVRQRLAKLTRPRLHAPLPRERLFRRLDDLRASPVVWITGPPGSGKTTLAASYLDAARLQALWLLLDPGDSDPATFFLYLRQAAKDHAPGRTRPLPLFTPEYLADLPGFARRFFRALFERVPAQTLLVLDNYHELEPDSSLHAGLAAALGEVAPAANLLILSRTEPPPDFAPALVSGGVAVLGWNELKLTAEEGLAVASAQGLDDPELARRLYAQTDGWFAGLALLLERARGGEHGRGAVRAEASEVVFDYFSQVIFDRAPPAMQRALLGASLLPHAHVAMLRAIPALADAPAHLEALYRRHLFVERTQDPVPTYRFHALFRAFLRHRVASTLTTDECARILRDAAAGFETGGLAQEAFSLWVELRDWPAAERTLVAATPALLAQGRWRTVLAWCDALPDTTPEQSPAVAFCKGRAMVHDDRVAARSILERAYDAYRAQGDRSGQIHCAAAVLGAIFLRYRDFRAMDAWIERLGHLLQEGPDEFAPDDALRIHHALLVAATYRNPEHPVLPMARQRVGELIGLASDPNIIVAAASGLHGYENTTLDVASAELACRIARRHLSSPELTAHTLAFYLSMAGYTEYMHGRYENALANLAAATDTIRDQGLNELAVNIEHWRALTQRRAGRLADAACTLERIESASAHLPEPPFAPRQFLRACIEYDSGHVHAAVAAVRLALPTPDSGGQFIGRMLVGLVCTHILIGAGELAAAGDRLALLRGLITGPVTDHFLAAIELNAAWLSHRAGDHEDRDRRLADALRRARDPRARERLRWYPEALATLVPVALREDIEVDMARDLVGMFDIRPTDLCEDEWPWRIRIRTLGGFEVHVDGQPLAYGRKAPKRTMALLQALVAFGGRDVGETRLTDALWPGDEADAAHRSLGAALHRLRALLGCTEAIRQSGGALSLDRERCFVDALALDHAADDPRHDERCVRLYRGAFLADTSGAAWALPMRERLRGRFVRAVERTGGRLEAEGRHPEAATLYERGLAADALIESFYRGLMRCSLAAGRETEAWSIYRRLQRTLALSLGTQPSDQTRSLLPGSESVSNP